MTNSLQLLRAKQSDRKETTEMRKKEGIARQDTQRVDLISDKKIVYSHRK